MKDIEIENISCLHVPVCSDWQEEIWRCSILGITHFLGKHSHLSQSFIIKVSQAPSVSEGLKVMKIEYFRFIALILIGSQQDHEKSPSYMITMHCLPSWPAFFTQINGTVHETYKNAISRHGGHRI